MRLPSRPNVGDLLAAALFAVIATASGANAQIFLGAGAGANAVAMPAPEPAAVAAPPAPSAAPAREILRFMPNTLDGLRLSGETGELRWPVYLTAAQAAAPLRFRVGYMSAVSLLPDASLLSVKVNDVAIGTDVIDAARSLRTIEFTIPPDLVRPGFNAVTIAVDQRHRVDCSVAATYELWTRLDPNETGLVLPPGTRAVTGVDDLAGLLPRADGTLPIHISLAGKTNPRHLARLVAATQRIALAAHALQPAVDFTATAADAYGVDLLLGTRDTLRRLPQIADQLGTDGALTKIVATGEARPMLIVTGSTEAELDQAVAGLAPRAEPVGTRAGLLALANYPALTIGGAGHFQLHEFGVRSQAFSGRFFRKSFNLSLPADFLASDYGRGTFDLAGGYAAGLTLDAQVRVDVNGRSSGIIKLPAPRGEVFQHNQLFLPLSLMRPGLNRIDVFAETPREGDVGCTAPDAKRFLFLDTSELVLPSLARVERLPDLALATSGAMPFTTGRAHLVVPKPDRDTMGAALSLTARAAVAAGRTIAFDFATKAPADDSGSTLVVSPARDLDPAAMREIGLDPDAVEAAWHDRAAAPAAPGPAAEADAPAAGSRWWLTRTDGPSACRLPAPTPAVAASADPRATAVPLPAMAPPSPMQTDSDVVLEAWTGASAATPGWRDTLAALPGAMADWAQRSGAALQRSALNLTGRHASPGQPERVDGISEASSLILAQGMSHGSRENVTTIVTAVDAPTLRASVACLFDPQVWSKVHGRLAVLDAATGDVAATDATRFHYIASERTALGNSRLVIAGWFSLNPLAFVAFALVTALCLGGTTLWFVRGVGRRVE